MGKSLLLGNGINAHLNISGMDMNSIYDRFLKLFSKETGVFKSIFRSGIDIDGCNVQLRSTEKIGIESLAKIVYESIADKNTTWSDNDEARLQDMITCLAVNAIFFDEKGKISSEFSKERLPCFTNYDSIFTMNYYEFWDKDKVCTHLHGFFDLSTIRNNTQLLFSQQRSYLNDYLATVKTISGNSAFVDLKRIVFAPEGLDKDQLIAVRGLYPSNKLYPADDLFLISPRKLYTELDGVREIEVFGLSPYGDDSLIEALNKICFVKVYVYDMKNSIEGSIWDKKLSTEHIIVDSSEIMTS